MSTQKVVVPLVFTGSSVLTFVAPPSARCPPLPNQIKDKLIFEQQKMDAFEQRKAREEQRKYAKELASNKQAEKSKRKREGLEEIEQWKKGTKRNRYYSVCSAFFVGGGSTAGPFLRVSSSRGAVIYSCQR